MSFFWIKRIKQTVLTLFALVFGVACLVGVRAQNLCRLAAIDGERVFYLNSASSQGLRKTELALSDFSKVRGESVRFLLQGKDESAQAAEILGLYGAETLFVEKVGGITSYYCYTEKWSNGISLYGQTVNLHVATDGVYFVVGTPIIFDGF